MRIAKRCSQQNNFDESCTVLFKNLKSQGYNDRELRNAKYRTLFKLNYYPLRVWNPGFHKCNIKNCPSCPFSMEGNTVYCKRNKNFELIYQNLTCCTMNVVYAITCKTCGDIIYVGETAK